MHSSERTEKGGGIFIDTWRMQNIYLALATGLLFRTECFAVFSLSLVYIQYVFYTYPLDYGKIHWSLITLLFQCMFLDILPD